MKRFTKQIIIGVIAAFSLIAAIFIAVNATPPTAGPSQNDVKQIVESITNKRPEFKPLSREQAMQGVAGVAGAGMKKKH